MYHLLLRKNFIAQHFLVGKDFGAENAKHSHYYTFDLEIAHNKLDQYQFLIDIVELKAFIDEVISCFSDKTLNEIPEFDNKNPSLELFCRILWEKFNNHSVLPAESVLTVSLWEDDIAKCTYRNP